MSEQLALVVEDDPRARGVLSLLLESAGWLVVAAEDGRAGLLLAMRTTPDVVITDLRMPIMTGIELARQLSVTPALRAVPRLAVTSDSADLREAAQRSGLFARVLTKPLSPSKLLGAVEEATGCGTLVERSPDDG